MKRVALGIAGGRQAALGTSGRFAIIAFALVSPVFLEAAEITRHESGVYLLAGTITAGDTAVFKTLLAADPTLLRLVGVPARGFVVGLDSPGGDVYEAMRLGRFLREKRAYVLVGQSRTCASACVLLLAGATRRSAWFGRVLVHRPYLEVAPELGLVESSWLQMSKDLRAYLAEMRVPEALADLMIRTPPEAAHALTREELDRFMLSATDPVQEEEDTASAAEELGVTSSEYRTRLVDSKDVCGNPEGGCPPTVPTAECTGRFDDLLAHIGEILDCRKAFIARIPMHSMQDRAALAREWRLRQGRVNMTCSRSLSSVAWRECLGRVLREE